MSVGILLVTHEGIGSALLAVATRLLRNLPLACEAFEVPFDGDPGALLPQAISLFGGYALTYGSLAGVIIALLFFWIVGFGLVMGAHLNAALANPESHRTAAGEADYRRRG